MVYAKAKPVTIGSCLVTKMHKSLPTGKSLWSLETDREPFFSHRRPSYKKRKVLSLSR